MKPCALPSGAPRGRQARGARGSGAMRGPGCAALWVLLLAQAGAQVSADGRAGPRVPSRRSAPHRGVAASSSRHLRAPWDPQRPRRGPGASGVAPAPRSRRAGWKRAVSARAEGRCGAGAGSEVRGRVAVNTRPRFLLASRASTSEAAFTVFAFCALVKQR